jgi:hypothetical protein
MASNTNNVKLGVCKVYFDNVDLGYTKGGVEVSVTTDTHKVTIDQFGKTPINEYIEGRQVSVKAMLAETTLRNLLKLMPGSVLVTDGVQAFGTVTFAANPGATNTVSIGGQAFQFQVANPSTVYQVKIGATQAESMANLVQAINLSPVALTQGGVTAEATSATVVRITAADPGTLGNAITLAVAGTTPPTVSGATFTGGVAETKARVDTSTGIGIDMLAISKALRLHPKAKADTDYSDDFVVHKTATPGALTFAYKFDDERVFNAEFNAYPDPVTNKLFSVGDPNAV